MRKIRILSAIVTVFASSTAALAGPAPIDNYQPSPAVTEVLPSSGIFPVSASGPGGVALGDTLGFVYSFAGNFTPGNALPANGALLPIQRHLALFSILGKTYGGNGVATFALPNLDGRTIIGAGNGFTVGKMIGANTFTLNAGNFPTLPPASGPTPGEGESSLLAISLLMALAAGFRRLIG